MVVDGAGDRFADHIAGLSHQCGARPRHETEFMLRPPAADGVPESGPRHPHPVPAVRTAAHSITAATPPGHSTRRILSSILRRNN